MMKKPKRRLPRYRNIEMVLSLLVRPTAVGVDEFLAGPKISGILAGYTAPLGGHVEKKDRKNPVTAANRENKEESGFKTYKGQIIGHVKIEIREKRERRLVTVVKYTRWSGKLTVDTDEYEWLDFLSVGRLKDLKLPPGDFGWLYEALRLKNLFTAHIICGRDRTDLIKARVRKVKYLKRKISI